MITKIFTILTSISNYIEHYKELKAKRDSKKKEKIRTLKKLKKEAVDKEPKKEDLSKKSAPTMIQATDLEDQSAF